MEPITILLIAAGVCVVNLILIYFVIKGAVAAGTFKLSRRLDQITHILTLKAKSAGMTQEQLADSIKKEKLAELEKMRDVFNAHDYEARKIKILNEKI